MGSAELQRFRAVQRLAYDCAEEVAEGLTEGTSEREAAARLGDRLHARGVKEYFHQPFAWFGDRTRFRNLRKTREFFPSARRLEPGMPAILDVAPQVDGYTADIGYSFAFGDNPAVEEALQDLQHFRVLILKRVRAGDSAWEIYRRTDALLRELGYDNIHRKYPFGVLGHRVYREASRGLARARVGGFGLGSAVGLVARELAARVPGLRQRSPFLHRGKGSDAPLEPGVWAIEPHIARGEVGVKWEELLVVEEGHAHWLDDDLPHVRRWARVGHG